jgi:hypothetical protein
MRQGINKIYLLQTLTLNYLHSISLTTVCLFITVFFMKLKELHVWWNSRQSFFTYFLKSFYSVEEMTVDP